MADNRILSRLGLLALPLALAACGEAGVGAGESGTEGSGGLTAQLKARCVEQVESMGAGDYAAVSEQICDCASRRAQSELSVVDLAQGDTSALETIMTQCADEALGIGATTTNEADI